MTISVNQVWSADSPAGSTTISATATGAITSGACLVGYSTWEAAENANSFVDDENGTYGSPLQDITDSTNGQEAAIWAFANSISVSAGGLVQTVTYNASAIFRGLIGIELLDALTSSAVVGSSGVVSAGSAGADGLAFASFTPTAWPYMVVLISMASGTFPGNAATASSGYTDHGALCSFGTGGGTGFYCRVTSKRNTTGTAFVGTQTRSANANHILIAIAIGETGASGGGGGGGVQAPVARARQSRSLLGVGFKRQGAIWAPPGVTA